MKSKRKLFMSMVMNGQRRKQGIRGVTTRLVLLWLGQAQWQGNKPDMKDIDRGNGHVGDSGPRIDNHEVE